MIEEKQFNQILETSEKYTEIILNCTSISLLPQMLKTIIGNLLLNIDDMSIVGNSIKHAISELTNTITECECNDHKKADTS